MRLADAPEHGPVELLSPDGRFTALTVRNGTLDLGSYTPGLYTIRYANLKGRIRSERILLVGPGR